MIIISFNRAKRGKRSEPGGLLADWKKVVGYRQAAAAPRPAQVPIKNPKVDDTEDEGEFDYEEKPEALAAVRASKASKVVIRDAAAPNLKVKGTQVSEHCVPSYQANSLQAIKVVERSVSQVEPTRRSKKEKYNVSALPFPNGIRAPPLQQRWRKFFRATLIEWAGTHSDPYGTNSKLDDDIINDIWYTVYPDLEMYDHIGEDSKEEPMEVITSVVSCFPSIYSRITTDCNRTGWRYLNRLEELHRVNRPRHSSYILYR